MELTYTAHTLVSVIFFLNSAHGLTSFTTNGTLSFFKCSCIFLKSAHARPQKNVIIGLLLSRSGKDGMLV